MPGSQTTPGRAALAVARCMGIGLKLLKGPAIDAGNHPRHQPARLAHFNDNCQTGVLIKGINRTAQVINLGLGAHPSVSSSDDDANPRHRPHSFFWPPVFLPDGSRRLLTRGGFFNPSRAYAVSVVRLRPRSQTRLP